MEDKATTKSNNIKNNIILPYMLHSGLTNSFININKKTTQKILLFGQTLKSLTDQSRTNYFLLFRLTIFPCKTYKSYHWYKSLIEAFIGS